MCRHCEHLIEDKEIVHQFMVVAAKRLSEKVNRPIAPDDVSLHLEIVEWRPPPDYLVDASKRMTRLVDDFCRDGGPSS